MRVIYKIARLELMNLFYSPVAWLLLIVFTMSSGNYLFNVLEYFAHQLEFAPGTTFIKVSQRLFYHPNAGTWRSVMDTLYLFMPLLMMGVIGQEFSRGTIKLLFSSPISSRQIVLGKYLGMWFYILMMTAILFIMVLVVGPRVEHFEWGAVLTGLLGIFLLLCLYTAIGLFMSSLTTYQIVAAIGMFVLLFFLEKVSSFGQEFSFIRDVTYWLSLSGRARTFVGGLICSDDVVYFIMLTGMFIWFTILRLQLNRERRSFLGKAGRYLGVFAIVVVVGYISSRPCLKFYCDATSTKDNTLTPASQEIMKELDGGLNFTIYSNFLTPGFRVHPKYAKSVEEMFSPYVRFKPEMKVSTVFYYHEDTTEAYRQFHYGRDEEEALKAALKAMNQPRRGYFLTPREIDERVDLSEEGYRTVCLLERENGQRVYVRFFPETPPYPSEREISAAMKRLAMKLPKVGFVAARGTRSISGVRNRDYSIMVAEKQYRHSLINQGFEVQEVYLSAQEELNDLTALVVPEPTEPFSSQELEILNRYIDSGKNLIIMGKPKTNEYLAPLLERLGLRFVPGTLVQPVEHLRQLLPDVRDAGDFPPSLLITTNTEVAEEKSLLFKNLYRVVMPGSAAIEVVEYKGFETIPLLVSQDTTAWNEVETVDFVNEVPQPNVNAGEKIGQHVVMWGLERMIHGLQQRVIVLGDADCCSIGELTSVRGGMRTNNGDMIMAMFGWLSYGELPVDIIRPTGLDRKVDITPEGVKAWNTILVWVFPGLLLLVGLVFLIRRRGK